GGSSGGSTNFGYRTTPARATNATNTATPAPTTQSGSYGVGSATLTGYSGRLVALAVASAAPTLRRNVAALRSAYREEMYGRGQPFEFLAATIDEHEPGSRQKIGHDTRDQNLVGVGAIGDPGRRVHRDTGDVAV